MSCVFAESVAAARQYATKYNYEIDANQEMIALGAANAGAGFSSGFVVDGSLSKSAASDEAGAKSQVVSILLAVMVLITVLFLTPLFSTLSEATLGAVVIHAIWRLIDFSNMLKELYHELKAEGIAFSMARMRSSVQEYLYRAGMDKTLGGEYFYPSVEVGVQAYLAGRDEDRAGETGEDHEIEEPAPEADDQANSAEAE